MKRLTTLYCRTRWQILCYYLQYIEFVNRGICTVPGRALGEELRPTYSKDSGTRPYLLFYCTTAVRPRLWFLGVEL
jgi:hypothetical protein